LFLFSVKEPKTSADELSFTSFLYSVKDEISADELVLTLYTELTAFKKHLITESKKAVSKDLCYNIDTSSQRHQSKERVFKNPKRREQAIELHQ
jgi:hypothetical protein